MTHDHDTARDMANSSALLLHHLRFRSHIRRWARSTIDSRETVQMLLPMRRPRRHGVMSEKNVRAAEIRSSLVGGFVPQTRGRAFRLQRTRRTALRPPHAKYSERLQPFGKFVTAVPQLTEARNSEILALSQIPNWM
jgi:hypothetical protein